MKITDPSNFRASDVDQRRLVGVPNNRPIKFLEQMPLRLRDRVSGKRLKQTDHACFSEMMQLFTCLSKKDFETNGCPKEVGELNTCWSKYLTEQAEKKMRDGQQTPLANQSVRDLTSAQVNNLLKKYPIQHLMKKIRK